MKKINHSFGSARLRHHLAYKNNNVIMLKCQKLIVTYNKKKSERLPCLILIFRIETEIR